MRDLPDDLDLLLALDVFLSERHITRAARRLGISQGAASQKLARLREFFDDGLLVPGRPLLLLTPRAQALAEPLARALAELRNAVRAGAPFTPGTSERRFVLLGNDLVEAYALPTLLALLARVAPGVSVSVERADVDFARRLEDGTADFAFVPDFLISSALHKRTLPPERFVVLLRARHPACRRRGQLSLEAYLALGHLLVAPRGMPGSIVDSALEALGKRRRVVARIQHFIAAPAIVAASELAVTCPASVAAAMARWIKLQQLAPPLELPIDRTSMVWHPRASDDPGHVWFRAQLDTILAELRRPS
ncbi:MAG: LysR family transcriptional regulator [Myxococcales bacterium]|nr:LysR family transcriptional regulator [Myxococcales bacterium]